MSEYRIQSETLEGIANAIREKTGDNALINPEDMADEIGSISIKNGVVYTDLRTDGRPTKVDFYGEIAYVWQLCASIYGNLYYYLTDVNFHGTKSLGYECMLNCTYLTRVTGLDNLTTIGQSAFCGCSSLKQAIVIPQTVTAIGDKAFMNSGITEVTDEHPGRITNETYRGCKSLWKYRGDKITSTYGVNQFYGCDGLVSFSMGSIGYGVTSIEYNNTFSGCTNELLEMTFYTNGSYVDTLLTRVRSGATNATIIIKASGETTYNGTTYQAGDTILTSEVESNES